MKHLPAILLCAASAVTGTLLGTWFFALLTAAPQFPGKMRGSSSASPYTEALQNEFSTALRRAMPMVVRIAPERQAGTAEQDLRRQLENTPPATGYGTGFLISKDGVIVTGEAVIRNHETWFVTTSDGHEYPAQYVGADPFSGLAVLKVSGRNDFPVLRFARNEELHPGQWVLIPGTAVSAGIISALPVRETRRLRSSSLLTTAALPQNGTGGPLIDLQCRIAGVLSGGIPGGSCAVSADLAKEITEELLRSGSIRRPWLGLLVSGGAAGLQVHAAAPHSPAADSLEAGDIILAANGKDIRSAYDLQTILMQTGTGNELKLTIRREGRTLTGSLRLGVSPANWFRKLSYPAGITVLAL